MDYETDTSIIYGVSLCYCFPLHWKTLYLSLPPFLPSVLGADTAGAGHPYSHSLLPTDTAVL